MLAPQRPNDMFCKGAYGIQNKTEEVFNILQHLSSPSVKFILNPVINARMTTHMQKISRRSHASIDFLAEKSVELRFIRVNTITFVEI